MALLDDVRKGLSVTSHYTDDVLQGFIDTALSDMRRVGVRPELLEEETIHPMVAFACAMFTDAYYNLNPSQTPYYEKAYHNTVVSLMNSRLSDYIDGPDSGSETGSDTSGDADGQNTGLGLGFGLGASGGH